MDTYLISVLAFPVQGPVFAKFGPEFMHVRGGRREVLLDLKIVKSRRNSRVLLRRALGFEKRSGFGSGHERLDGGQLVEHGLGLFHFLASCERDLELAVDVADHRHRVFSRGSSWLSHLIENVGLRCQVAQASELWLWIGDCGLVLGEVLWCALAVDEDAALVLGLDLDVLEVGWHEWSRRHVKGSHIFLIRSWGRGASAFSIHGLSLSRLVLLLGALGIVSDSVVSLFVLGWSVHWSWSVVVNKVLSFKK